MLGYNAYPQITDSKYGGTQYSQLPEGKYTTIQLLHALQALSKAEIMNLSFKQYVVLPTQMSKPDIVRRIMERFMSEMHNPMVRDVINGVAPMDIDVEQTFSPSWLVPTFYTPSFR